MKRFMKRSLNYVQSHRILAGIALIILAVAVYIFWPKPQPPVSTYTIANGNIVRSVSVSGKVNAKKIVDLSFQIGGKVSFLGVQLGDSVAAYQTVAMLDSRTAQKNLQAALIAYSNQRITFDQTQDNNQNRTPQQALNDAMMRILQTNQNNLNAAVNSVDLQALAQEQSVLVSPLAGIVTREDIKTAGVNVTPTAVIEVTDPRSLVFDMDVDEADIGTVKTGQNANVVLDAYPNTTLRLPVNWIDFVSHTTSTGGNAYTVELPLSDVSGLKYRVGMNGNADITTGEKDNVTVVPINSVVDNTYVYLKHGKKFAKVSVRLGLQNDTNAEVISGLSAGDQVAVDPTKITKNDLE